MQTQTITFFATVSNAATSRTFKTGCKYTAFGVSIILQPNQPPFPYNVLAWGKQSHFAKSLQKDTRIKLVVQAQSQPDNIASTPLLTQPSCDRFIRSHRSAVSIIPRWKYIDGFSALSHHQ